MNSIFNQFRWGKTHKNLFGIMILLFITLLFSSFASAISTEGILGLWYANLPSSSTASPNDLVYNINATRHTGLALVASDYNPTSMNYSGFKFGLQTLGYSIVHNLTKTGTPIDLSQEGTISFWIYSLGGNNNQDPIIVTDSFGATYSNKQIIVDDPEYGRLLAGYTGNSNCMIFSSTDSQLPTNTWTHLALTWKANGRILLYRNGAIGNSNSSCNGTGISDLKSVIALNFRGATGLTSNNQNINGYYDTLFIFNRQLSSSEVNELYHYSEIGNPVTHFSSPTPANNTANNSKNVLLNLTCTYGNSTIYFGSITDPTYIILNNQPTGLVNISNFVSDEGKYYYKGSCDGGKTNTSIYTWTYDITNPDIIINSNNFFTADNLTVVNQFDGGTNFLMNISFQDSNQLYAYQWTINHNSNGTIVPGLDTGEQLLSNNSYTYVGAFIPLNYLTVSEWYDVNVWISDTHTNNKEFEKGNYKITKQNKEINFYTNQKNNIRISTDTDATIDEEQTTDRYKLNIHFDKSKSRKDKTFYLECDGDLKYISDSKYKAHFICINGDWKTNGGNWIDFEGIEGTPFIYKENSHKYSITFYNAPNDIQLHSIGGLNVNHKTYKFYFPNHKILKTSMNTSNEQYPPIVGSTLQIYQYLSSELGGRISAGVDLFENNSFITTVGENTPMYGVTLLYNISSPLKLGTSYTASGWVLANCPTCVDGYAVAKENSLSNTLTPVKATIDNCSNINNITSNATTLNVSFYDVNRNLVAINYQSILNYGTNLSKSNILTISNTNSTSFKVCSYPSWVNMYSDIFIYYNNMTYKYSYLLSNITTQINITIINGTYPITYTVFDYDDNEIEDTTIKVLRWDIPSSSYYTTEILSTDNVGDSVGQIELGTAFYRWVIEYNGVPYLTFPETQGIRQFTQEREFRIDLGNTAWFDNYLDVLKIYNDLYYNNLTNTFHFSWSDSTNTISEGCLQVVKRNQTGSLTLYDSCVESTASDMLYTITPTNQSTFIATGYFKYNGEIYTGDTEEISFGGDLAKTDSDNFPVLISLIIIITITLLGISHPFLSYIGFGLGLITAVILQWWLVSLGAVVGILIVGAIHLRRFNNK